MKLDERLILLRKRAGLSQEKLAEKLDISRQAVSKWESGVSQS
ncbi:helix-turn-helix transcriptional regulator [Lachnospiraceae bacterium 64-25]